MANNIDEFNNKIDILKKKVAEQVKMKYPNLEANIIEHFLLNNSNSVTGSHSKSNTMENVGPSWELPPIRRRVTFRGKFYANIKKIIRYLLQPVVKYIFTNQVAINNILLQQISNIEKNVEQMQSEVSSLVEKINFQAEIYRKDFKALERGIDSLEVEYCSVIGTLKQFLIEKDFVYLPSTGDASKEYRESLIERNMSCFDYKRFNEEFSGDVSHIMQLYQQYIPYFQGCNRILDLGCGRGPFLRLLKEHGIDGYGVDTDQRMIADLNKEGFEVIHADSLVHLVKIEDQSLGGIFVGHLVEHLPLLTLVTLLRLAKAKIKEDGYLIFETPNTESLYVLSKSYFKDVTHQMPRHPEFYRFIVEEIGFRQVELKTSYHLPIEEMLVLKEKRDKNISTEEGQLENSIIYNFNKNMEFLRDLLFGGINVSIIAKK